jgi:hypothetical protein
MEVNLRGILSFYAIQGKMGEQMANILYCKKQKRPSFCLINITT